MTAGAGSALARADVALDTLWAVASGSAPNDTAAVSDALRSLAAAVAVSQRATAFARQRGAVTLLRRWLCDADESVLELAAAAVASLASSDTRLRRTYTFGACAITLRDASAVTGGLGWRVWRAALILCDLLTETPALVRGRRVLEVGAGCGCCGMLAAALGAADTVLTDCLPGLLEALDENVALNAAAAAVAEANAGGPSWAARTSALGGGTLSVRHLAWEEAPDAASDAAGAAADASDAPAPRLACDEAFDVIVGSDVMYEMEHAAALPRVLARHLARGGFALLVCGVRFPDVLDAFLARLDSAGLQCTSAQLRKQQRAAAGGGASEEHTEEEEEEDESVTMCEPPLGQLGMLIWRAGEAPPPGVVPPPWAHSWVDD
jgi:predicted nicotinamide N-methyase